MSGVKVETDSDSDDGMTLAQKKKELAARKEAASAGPSGAKPQLPVQKAGAPKAAAPATTASKASNGASAAGASATKTVRLEVAKPPSAAPSGGDAFGKPAAEGRADAVAPGGPGEPSAAAEAPAASDAAPDGEAQAPAKAAAPGGAGAGKPGAPPAKPVPKGGIKRPAQPSSSEPAAKKSAVAVKRTRPAKKQSSSEESSSDDSSSDDSGSSSSGSGSSSSSSGSGSDSSDSSSGDSDSSDDDVPLARRKAAVQAKAKSKAKSKGKAEGEGRRRARAAAEPRGRRRRNEGGGDDQNREEPKWEFQLEHNGVLFPPEYEPHGIPILYDGEPVELSPEAEEVATMFAAMRESDYMNKHTFRKNFWEDWKAVLGPRHVIKDLSKCDFLPIYEYLTGRREAKKTMPAEEKKQIQQEREQAEARFKFAIIDGRKERIGNFRVEPPGLFRGRGEHPKMGKLKKRIYPRDVTLNLSENAPVPPSPYPDQTWKEVVSNKHVTWLAYWKDPILSRGYKYVHLAADSAWKGKSDREKYEKARELKSRIEEIRRIYTESFRSEDRKEAQIAVAIYFIDKLALRAGHEKDEDEADTVGCCTLRCEHVDIEPGNSNRIKLQFLGKDSMMYENTFEVDPVVHDLVMGWVSGDAKGKSKRPNDPLFDAFSAGDLNQYLGKCMVGLTAKVFRTFNASATLDRLLVESERRMDENTNLEAKLAAYNMANKEVAILCNHQRSVPKGHAQQMAKLDESIQKAEEELKKAEDELEAMQEDKEYVKKGGKNNKVEAARKRVNQKREKLGILKSRRTVRENLKTVALGTSKINYMDPRITVAWCKRNEVPLEKIFNRSLLAKFNWCLDVEPEFRF